MKTSIAALLGLIGTLLSGYAVSAQQIDAITPPTRGQSELLRTEPVSVKRPGELQQRNLSVQTTTKLNDISKSIQANPGQSTSGTPGFLDKLLQQNLIHTPTVQNSDANPIGFFQVPPSSPSVGVNLNEIR